MALFISALLACLSPALSNPADHGIFFPVAATLSGIGKVGTPIDRDWVGAYRGGHLRHNAFASLSGNAKNNADRRLNALSA